MPPQRSFFIQQILIVFCSAFLLCTYLPVAGQLDLSLISPWLTTSGEFPLKNNWFLATLNHHYVKYLLILIYCGFLYCWITAIKNAEPRIKQWQYAYLFISTLIFTSLIAVIKSQSNHACPWDMTIPTQSTFHWGFSIQNGHCFPGGHASAGFALLSGYFVFRLDQPKRAYFYLFAGLILGFGMGWAQMMRGAHFLSHNLWTAWIIWTGNCLAYFIVYHYFSSSTFKSIAEPSTGKITSTFNPPKV